MNTSVAFELSVVLLNLDYPGSYCIAAYDGSCALGYWGVFNMVPLGLIMLQFMLRVYFTL